MLKINIVSKKQTSPRIERRSDLLDVLNIPNINENTFPEINDNFLEVLSSVVRYHIQRKSLGIERHPDLLETSQRSCTSSRIIKILSLELIITS